MSTPRSVRRSAARVAASLAVLALTTATLVATQVAGASPAAAVTGIEKVTGTVSPTDSQPSKTAPAAFCPPGKRVIGGGGWVNTTATGADTVGLTELRPVHPATGQDSFVVSAQELSPSTTTTWWVQAYAICANPVAGLNIVSRESVPLSEGSVFCPTGQKVLGAGARVNNPANRVALNFVGPDDAGDRVHAAASDVTLTTRDWSVTPFAVCAPAPAGYQVVFAPSTQNQSEPEKVAFISCPAGTRVHGAAGGVVASRIGGSKQGLVLQVVYPFNALDQVEAFAVETVPNPTNWDVRAVAFCAT